MNPFVLEILDQLEAPVIFEFGCFDGADTYELVRNGFSRFYSFEADPRNIQKIKSRGLPEGVVLVEKAIGRSTGMTDFYPSSNFISGHGLWTGSSSTKKPSSLMAEVSPQLQFAPKIQVPVVSLDDFCADVGIEKIDLIWADIQGGEIDLVAGGTEMIPKTRYLFMEHEKFQVYEGQWNLEEMMAALPGWRIIERFPNDVLLENTRFSF